MVGASTVLQPPHPPSLEPHESRAAPSPRTGRRLLLVDDSHYLRARLRPLVEQAGFEVAGEAADGLEAIDRYRLGRPDAVIMDLVLPRLDGIGAIRRILELDPQARIIALSAGVHGARLVDALLAGACGFLVKPLQPEWVRRTLQGVLVDRTPRRFPRRLLEGMALSLVTPASGGSPALLAAAVTDISLSGLEAQLASTTGELVPGSSVTCVLRLADRELRIPATVGRAPSPALSVSFAELPEASEAAIKSFLAERLGRLVG